MVGVENINQEDQNKLNDNGVIVVAIILKEEDGNIAREDENLVGKNKHNVKTTPINRFPATCKKKQN